MRQSKDRSARQPGKSGDKAQQSESREPGKDDEKKPKTTKATPSTDPLPDLTPPHGAEGPRPGDFGDRSGHGSRGG